MIYYRTPKGNTTLTVLFSLVYFSVLRGDNCPAGSFDSVECHILMTLSTQSSHHASRWFFPHLNNSISEAASPAQGAWRRVDRQIHNGWDSWNYRWARAEEKVGAGSWERENLSGLELSSLITPLSLFPPFLVLFFLLRRRLSWQYWTQFPWRKAEPESFHHFIHWGDTVEKGPSWPLILPGPITNFHSILFMALWGCYLEGDL